MIVQLVIKKGTVIPKRYLEFFFLICLDTQQMNKQLLLLTTGIKEINDNVFIWLIINVILKTVGV